MGLCPFSFLSARCLKCAQYGVGIHRGQAVSPCATASAAGRCLSPGSRPPGRSDSQDADLVRSAVISTIFIRSDQVTVAIRSPPGGQGASSACRPIQSHTYDLSRACIRPHPSCPAASARDQQFARAPGDSAAT